MHYWRCFVWGHCVLLKNQSCLYLGHLLLSTRLTTIHCQRTLFSRFCESLQFAMNTEYQLQQPCPTTLLCNHLDSFFVTLPLLRISISNLVFTWLSILAGQPIKRDHLGTPSNLFSVLWLTEMTMDKYSAVKRKRWSEKVNMSERERRWAHYYRTDSLLWCLVATNNLQKKMIIFKGACLL